MIISFTHHMHLKYTPTPANIEAIISHTMNGNVVEKLTQAVQLHIGLCVWLVHTYIIYPYDISIEIDIFSDQRSFLLSGYKDY